MLREGAAQRKEPLRLSGGQERFFGPVSQHRAQGARPVLVGEQADRARGAREVGQQGVRGEGRVRCAGCGRLIGFGRSAGGGAKAGAFAAGGPRGSDRSFERGHEVPLALFGRDVAFSGKLCERAFHGDAADAQVARQHAFGGQARARCQRAAFDVRTDMPVELVIERQRVRAVKLVGQHGSSSGHIRNMETEHKHQTRFPVASRARRQERTDGRLQCERTA